jgi:NADPH2:quinone reductase
LPVITGHSAETPSAAHVRRQRALGMLSTMRLEGHTALVHTAAASNLRQTLNKLCLADDVQLVNVVRSPEQERVLKNIGAKHIVNSTAPDFREQLTTAVKTTGVTLVFDAIGGGPLAGQILTAMEEALVADAPAADQYGSRTHKQVYTYGRLDLAPTTIPAAVGMAWAIGCWLLFSHLARIGQEATQSCASAWPMKSPRLLPAAIRVKSRSQRRLIPTSFGVIGARKPQRSTCSCLRTNRAGSASPLRRVL